MFRLFNKSKSFKIRGFSGNKKYGVAAKDLNELLKKGCEFLQVPRSGAQVCLYEDGTIVTEKFFSTLPDNTELVLLSRGQTWDGVVCDIGKLLNTDRHADRLIDAARELLCNEKSPKRRKILSDVLLNLDDRSEMESREDDKDWFTGVDARFKTKSAYMKFNCECRIRSYMREVDEATRSAERPRVRAGLLEASKRFTEMLKKAKYNGCYFDRTGEESERLCTREGWFTCQGSFDEKACPSLHSINPYGSRENRIVFSTWNLDHGIEKKRTVIPTLVDALQNHISGDVNLEYFYRLLFTRENLKLVHIVCHKKGAHNRSCDEDQIFISMTSARKRPRMR